MTTYITYHFTAAGGHSGSFTYDNTAVTNDFVPFGQGGPSYPGLSFVLDGNPIPNPVIQIFDNYQGLYDIVYFTTTTGGPSVELFGAAGSTAAVSGSGLDQLDSITLQDFIPAFRNLLYSGAYTNGGAGTEQLTSFAQ